MKQTNSLPNVRQGFTLVELMIVLAVIAILIATFTVSMSSITNQNNAATMEAAVGKVRNAIYDYAQDNGSFPQSLSNLTSPYNYLNNMNINNNSILVPNIGTISYNNNAVSPCSSENLNIQFENTNICQEVANDFQNNGINIGNNCNNNQIILCL